ncbi:MAG TPA: DUF5681 domain-containing protein [Fimbriimonadaceae bacterium]|nr:DUF5681 domain-containing protein [Fimbriimonadaceae bacterium]
MADTSRPLSDHEMFDSDEEPEEARRTLQHSIREAELTASLRSNRPGRGGNVPPAAHRFKPGQSGNPRGRPRALLGPLMRELLLADDGRVAKAVVKAWLRQACNGNRTALREILERVDGELPEVEPQP